MSINKLHIALLLFALTACAPSALTETPAPTETPQQFLPVLVAEENAYAPKPTDAELDKVNVTIASIGLAERTIQEPKRINVYITGSLPGSCDELRVEIAPPDMQGRVFLQIYGLANPNVKCENVFTRFEANILLGVYPPGQYTVYVNGGIVGDFYY